MKKNGGATHRCWLGEENIIYTYSHRPGLFKKFLLMPLRLQLLLTTTTTVTTSPTTAAAVAATTPDVAAITTAITNDSAIKFYVL